MLTTHVNRLYGYYNVLGKELSALYSAIWYVTCFKVLAFGTLDHNVSIQKRAICEIGNLMSILNVVSLIFRVLHRGLDANVFFYCHHITCIGFSISQLGPDINDSSQRQLCSYSAKLTISI